MMVMNTKDREGGEILLQRRVPHRSVQKCPPTSSLHGEFIQGSMTTGSEIRHDPKRARDHRTTGMKARPLCHFHTQRESIRPSVAPQTSIPTRHGASTNDGERSIASNGATKFGA